MAPQSPKPDDDTEAVDLTRICWTQWLRAQEGSAEAVASDPPVRRRPPPDLEEIERLFKDC
jgi:hypothetical protein